jgi:predicted MPP superfamily phosphohydrolase
MTNYGKIAALYLSKLWLIGIRITVKTNKAYSTKHYAPTKLSSIAQAFLIFLFGKLLEAKISSKISFSRLKGRNITVRQAT